MRMPACDEPTSGAIGGRSLRSLAAAHFDQILAGKRAVRAVEHPLDFVCIPIVRTSRIGLCGHIWSSGSSAPTIHSHSWHLYSEIVLGAITNEVFRAIPQPTGDHQVIRVRSAGLTDTLFPGGPSVRVNPESNDVFQVGDSYALDADTFHRSTPATSHLTLTLVRAVVLDGHHDQILVRSPGSVRTTRRELLPESAARPLAALFREAIEERNQGRFGPIVTNARAGTQQRRSHAPGSTVRTD